MLNIANSIISQYCFDISITLLLIWFQQYFYAYYFTFYVSYKYYFFSINHSQSLNRNWCFYLLPSFCFNYIRAPTVLFYYRFSVSCFTASRQPNIGPSSRIGTNTLVLRSFKLTNWTTQVLRSINTSKVVPKSELKFNQWAKSSLQSAVQVYQWRFCAKKVCYKFICDKFIAKKCS